MAKLMNFHFRITKLLVQFWQCSFSNIYPAYIHTYTYTYYIQLYICIYSVPHTCIHTHIYTLKRATISAFICNKKPRLKKSKERFALSKFLGLFEEKKPHWLRDPNHKQVLWIQNANYFHPPKKNQRHWKKFRNWTVNDACVHT